MDRVAEVDRIRWQEHRAGEWTDRIAYLVNGTRLPEERVFPGPTQHAMDGMVRFPFDSGPWAIEVIGEN